MHLCVCSRVHACVFAQNNRSSSLHVILSQGLIVSGALWLDRLQKQHFHISFDCCYCLSYEVNSFSCPELFRCGVPGKACGFASGNPNRDWGPHPQQALWLWFPVHRERMSGKGSLLTYHSERADSYLKNCSPSIGHCSF